MRRHFLLLIGLFFAAPAHAQATSSGHEWTEIVVFLALLLCSGWLAVALLKRVSRNFSRDSAIGIAASAIKVKRRLAASWSEFIRQARDRAGG